MNFQVRIEAALGVLSYAFLESAFNPTAFGGSSGWTDITPDVSLRDGETVSFARGLISNAPTDRVAGIGTMSFYLRNDAANSCGVLACYSPNSPTARAGWIYGIPIRLIGLIGTTHYPIWLGKLRAVTPVPGRFGEQRVHCLAQDCMGDLSDNDVRSVAPQLSRNENQLLQTIISSLPATAQPAGSSLDAGLDTYPYALDNIGGGIKALTLMSDLVISALGYLYPLNTGYLHYENRQAAANKLTSLILDEEMDALMVPSDLQNVFNHVRVTNHPRRVDAAATTVLYASQSAIAVAPGQTVEVWGSYASPTNTLQLIGGTAIVTPIVATTDYLANAAADGSGANLTASLSVVTSAFAAAVKFALTNTGGTSLFVTKLQVRGKGIYDESPVTFDSYTAASYGDRPLDVDLPYQNDANIAKDMADFLKSQYLTPKGQVDEVGFICRTDALLLQALTREIGDVVTLTEPMTGLQGSQVTIRGISGEVHPGAWLSIRWNCGPHAAGGAWVFDDPVNGLLDSTTIFGFA